MLKMDKILNGKNVKFPGNTSLVQYFEGGFRATNNGKSPRITPDNVAVIEEEKTLTFRDLYEKSSKLAHVLKTHFLEGIPIQANADEDYLIGICVTPSVDLILGLFGILKLGAGYVPFDIKFPEDRIIKMCELSKPLLVICDNVKTTIEKFDKVHHLTKVITISEVMKKVEELNDTIIEEVEPFPGNKNLFERIAIVLYTSGSTGIPKGVRLNHRTAMNRIYWNWNEYPFREYENERNCLKTTLTFVDSVWEIFGPLLQGKSLTVFTREIVSNPSLFIRKVQQHSITRICLVPSLLRAIFQTIKFIGEEEGKSMLKSVYYWVCSSEILSLDLLEEFFRLFPEDTIISNFYGSTETIADVTFQLFSTKDDIKAKTIDGKVPIGIPMYNSIIYILDEELKMVKKGDVGEIYIAGYNLATGYAGIKHSDKFLNNPHSITPGYNRIYKTGDFGHFGVNSLGVTVLIYDGRLDSQIKVRGQRVDMNEILATISIKTVVDKCAVLCYKPGESQQKIIAFVVKVEGTDEEDIVKMFREKLRDYEVPELRVVKEIPLLTNGKTDRQKLLRDYENDKLNNGTFENWDKLGISNDKLDGGKVLIEIISDLTGMTLKEVAEGLDNSFYTVGGNSLNSIVAVTNLREKNYFIEIVDFVAAKSLREIIELLVIRSKEEIENVESRNKLSSNYTFEDMNESHREEVLDIISGSFSRKGDLEKYTLTKYEEFQKMISSIWEFLLKNGFSSILRRTSDEMIVGATLAFDYYNEPEEIELAKGLEIVLDFLDFIEKPQSEKLPFKEKGKLLHVFMMGTLLALDAGENVSVMQIMSEKIIEKGQNLGFEALFATDTNPITKQIAKLLGWELLLDYQINQYVSAKDGEKPFKQAPDNESVYVCWKKLN